MYLPVAGTFWNATKRPMSAFIRNRGTYSSNNLSCFRGSLSETFEHVVPCTNDTEQFNPIKTVYAARTSYFQSILHKMVHDIYVYKLMSLEISVLSYGLKQKNFKDKNMTNFLTTFGIILTCYLC
uniref:Uncharacterized protein n=1 Tax=Pararge aegeria TaxID=116150 RepID=S4NRZ5_9NEOP